jgi:cytochrome c oxidase assembly protein subunit 15
MEQEVNPSYNPSLHRYALALAICTLFLVVAGASVTSNQAGLSVPDWPLSYGQVMPQMTGGVFFEHGHRMVATFVGMLTIGLAFWLSRRDQRAWMRKLGWAALGAVIVQGGLGGLTVLLLLPPAVSVSHACLAQLFFSTTVAIAVFTSKSWFEEREMVNDYGRPSLRSLALLAPAMVLAQIALGASFRHGAIGMIPHIVGSMVVALTILIIGAFVLHQFPEHPTLRPAAIWMLGITLFQIALGIEAYWARINAVEKPLAMVLATVAHVATGALTMASTVVLAIQVRRHVRSAEHSESTEAAVMS